MNKCIKLIYFIPFFTGAFSLAMDSEITTDLGRELILAIINREPTQLRTLIAQKANINYIHHCGDTALILAAQHGQLECVYELIQAKADINYMDKWGNTALIEATDHGQPECAYALIQAKANINHANNLGGMTALMKAAFYSHPTRLECLRELIKANAQIDLESNEGSTALTIAAVEDSQTNVRELIKAKANMYHTDKDGDTILMRAARRNREEMCEILVRALHKQSIEQFIVLLFGCKKKQNCSLSQLQLPRDIRQLIGQYIFEAGNRLPVNQRVLEEINKIERPFFRWRLIQRYHTLHLPSESQNKSTLPEKNSYPQPQVYFDNLSQEIQQGLTAFGSLVTSNQKDEEDDTYELLAQANQQRENENDDEQEFSRSDDAADQECTIL